MATDTPTVDNANDIARIKRNITKMINMEAPDSDIEAYVKSEGVTPEQLRAFGKQPKQETFNWKDALTAPLKGLGKAAVNAVDTLDKMSLTIAKATPWREGVIVWKDGGLHLEDEQKHLENRIANNEAVRHQLESDTTVGQLLNGITQVAAPFAAYNKALSSIGMAREMTRMWTAGTLTDLTAFSPFEKRLSDVAEEYGVKNWLTDYLKADPENDNWLEDKGKMALEGAALGAVAEPFVRAARFVKSWKMGRKVLKARAAERAKQVLKGKKVITQQEGLDLDKHRIVMLKRALGKDYESIVKSGDLDKIVVAGENALVGNLDVSKRISQHLSEAIIQGKIKWEDLPSHLRDMNLSLEQFAGEFLYAGSKAGYDLNRFSHLSKKLGFAFKKNPELAQAFERYRHVFEGNEIDHVFKFIRTAEDFRRSLLVTQLKTAARNAGFQTGRVALSYFDENFQSLFKSAFRVGTGGELGGAAGGLSREMAANLDAARVVYNRFSPKDKARFAQLLDTHSDIIKKSRLFSQPVNEVGRIADYTKSNQVIPKLMDPVWEATGPHKVSQFLNTFNRFQEIGFRKLAFESKLRQIAKMKGHDWNTMDFNKFSNDDILDAANHAFELTLSSSAKSYFGRGLINVWNKAFITTLTNPFPRFAFANALPFIRDFSPVGFYKAFGNGALDSMARGNPEVFAKHASRAILGSLAFAEAYNLRDKWAPEGLLWYEVPAGEGKVTDTRPYAPGSSMLFLAEATRRIVNGERPFTPAEYAQQAVGLNRISGTGVELLNALFDKQRNGESWALLGQKMAGQYFASFAVPARQIRDFSTLLPYMNDEEVVKTLTLHPSTAPIMNNFPIWDQQLKPATDPHKPTGDSLGFFKEPTEEYKGQKYAGLLRAENPALSQLTGVSKYEKNEVQRWRDRLQLPENTFYARTGDPEANYYANGYMGQLSKLVLEDRLFKTQEWKDMPTEMKRQQMKEIVSMLKGVSVSMLGRRHPDILGRLMDKEIWTDDFKRMMKQLGHDPDSFPSIEKLMKEKMNGTATNRNDR